jgi:hypothetical protein
MWPSQVLPALFQVLPRGSEPAKWFRVLPRGQGITIVQTYILGLTNLFQVLPLGLSSAILSKFQFRHPDPASFMQALQGG